MVANLLKFLKKNHFFAEMTLLQNISIGNDISNIFKISMQRCTLTSIEFQPIFQMFRILLQQYPSLNSPPSPMHCNVTKGGETLLSGNQPRLIHSLSVICNFAPLTYQSCKMAFCLQHKSFKPTNFAPIKTPKIATNSTLKLKEIAISWGKGCKSKHLKA